MVCRPRHVVCVCVRACVRACAVLMCASSGLHEGTRPVCVPEVPMCLINPRYLVFILTSLSHALLARLRTGADSLFFPSRLLSPDYCRGKFQNHRRRPCETVETVLQTVTGRHPFLNHCSSPVTHLRSATLKSPTVPSESRLDSRRNHLHLRCWARLSHCPLALRLLSTFKQSVSDPRCMRVCMHAQYVIAISVMCDISGHQCVTYQVHAKWHV
jgi:hypothetical protein